MKVILGIVTLSTLIWVFLLTCWGQFWLANQRIENGGSSADFREENYPVVRVIIPARNEEEVLERALRSLVVQDYPGSYHLVVIDDHSSDRTATIAHSFPPVTVISAQPLPPGWTGKLWAMEQGVKYNSLPRPDYYLFTDADIAHPPHQLTQLVQKAQQEHLELVSLMVKLHCVSGWEKLLIPAFVFFFQKLYPFAWVNHPQKATAAAAGGCILIHQAALTRIGGLESLREALIDDCTLAQAVKSTGSGRLWLGLTESTVSLRSYESLKPIWEMVARTAFTQLNYSPGLLLGTLVGMGVVYVIPPVAWGWGMVQGMTGVALLGGMGWIMMAIAYLPTARLYGQSPLTGFQLPLIAILYTLMTLDSAWHHWQGKGGNWKGRVYRN